jgi:hypothetical protein
VQIDRQARASPFRKSASGDLPEASGGSEYSAAPDQHEARKKGQQETESSGHGKRGDGTGNGASVPVERKRQGASAADGVIHGDVPLADGGGAEEREAAAAAIAVEYGQDRRRQAAQRLAVDDRAGVVGEQANVEAVVLARLVEGLDYLGYAAPASAGASRAVPTGPGAIRRRRAG